MRTLVCGALAGAAGTAAMDLLGYARYRRDGGDGGFAGWETSAGLGGWDNAPAPAKFGRRVVERTLHRELPPDQARLTNNVVHWTTGVGWGAAFGLVGGFMTGLRLWHGLVFGAGVWLQSYAVLVPAKLYKPPWEYDPKTLWEDLSTHLVYGLSTAAAFRILAVTAGRRQRGRSTLW
ncbi:MAG: DUF1440 domain-containing protein [Mycobacteriaceae bacterium]|nr:DUF1440 domain-containing protein [Mycobacteriaceae bacterium]